MRILILSPRLPWPPRDGGRVAMARLAQSLARCGADVEILSLNPRKHHADPATAPMHVDAVGINTSRVIAPALRALTSDVPYLIARFESREFREAVRKRNADIVQIESPFMLPYAGAIAKNARVVFRPLNVEFRIWEGLAANEPNPLRRIALKRIAASLRRYEVRQLNATDAIVPISEADAADFRALGATRPMHVVPCGVELPAAGESEPDTVGFIGSLDFRPNQQAVEWIVDELWPRVIARAPEARLTIAGSSPPEWLRKKIAIRSDVDDAQQFMRRMSIIIAPLFAGGGMRIKVLEAMALAKPIVATPLGAGGIDVAHDRDILLANDAAAFADGVVRLLHDRATAKRIGDAARANVAARYDSDTLARGVLQFYESL